MKFSKKRMLALVLAFVLIFSLSSVALAYTGYGHVIGNNVKLRSTADGTSTTNVIGFVNAGDQYYTIEANQYDWVHADMVSGAWTGHSGWISSVYTAQGW